jgi:hypothetical protein
MSPEQWDSVKDLYETALECDPAQRADFVQRRSADAVVRNEVQRLLAEHDNVGNFLSTPLLWTGTSPLNNRRSDLLQETFWPTASCAAWA